MTRSDKREVRITADKKRFRSEANKYPSSDRIVCHNPITIELLVG
jgi:hypothetical protein